MAKAKKSDKKKSEKKKPNKKKRLLNKFPKPDPNKVIHDINMKYGDAGPIIRAANNAWDASDLRRPCGIPSLDLATGGGLVAGKVHQIDGPESTGKNYLLYRYFAEAQRRYGKNTVLAMCCFESFVDKQFAQSCGCRIAMSRYDIEVSNLARATRGEPPLTKKEEKEALECPGVGEFHILEGPSEKVLDGVVEAVRSNIYQIIGIDSWDAMMTMPEERATLEEVPQVASPATIQTRWAKKTLDAFNPIFRCPKCGYAPIENKVTNYELQNYKYVCKSCEWSGKDPATEVNETTLYCIRQVRSKISMTGQRRYGRDYKTDGANALQHLNHIRISLHPGSAIKDGNIKIGKEVNWEIAKAKAGAKEGRTGMFTLYFNPIEVDVARDMMAQCIEHKVILDRGAGWFEFPEIDMDQIHGKDAVLDMIEKEPELLELLRELLYIKADLSHLRFT